ncbi:MAG: 4-hydroxythreonine-4-phosphate dehydrogenase PdxA [Leptospirales bacterium]
MNNPLFNTPTEKPLFLYLNKEKLYNPGQPDTYFGGRSFKYIEAAAKLWKKLPSAGLITLPVSKEWIIRSGIAFSGHTEYLSSLYRVNVVMCMYHPELSVIPLTNHIPIKQVPDQILSMRHEPIEEALAFFINLFAPQKKIAFTGLNPHAGEGGKIGNEEEYLTKLFENIHTINPMDGPLPADGLFSPTNRKLYSLVIACYHDQALIPFKALYGPLGINITLNLPKLRVSPDHGPAYDCAGKNIAAMESVIESLRFAIEKGTQWILQYSSH